MGGAARAESWTRRHHFLLRRLHSLTGVVPVGAFLVVHLFTNSLAAYDPRSFDAHVREIHALPYLTLVEVFGIFLPLGFHAAYGVVIARQGRSNVRSYPWLDNVRYTLQRVTGWIALVFIAVHLLHFRFAHWVGGPAYQEAVTRGMTPFDITQWGFVATPVPTSLWTLLYVVGLTAAVYHFCNGLGTFCITWGITVGDAARRRVLIGAAGLAVVLLIWGGAALWALTARPAAPLRLPPPERGAPDLRAEAG